MGAAVGLCYQFAYVTPVRFEDHNTSPSRYPSYVSAQREDAGNVKQTPMEISLPPGLQFKPTSPN